MGRIAAVALAAAAVALVVTACGERSEPTGPEARLYPVTVPTGADRPLVVQAPARRIAVLGPGPRAILVALGAARQIAGAPLDRNGDVQLRRLRQLQPDLIVASAAASDVVLSRAVKETHAQVYQAPGDSIGDVERSITELGLLVGHPVEARALVRRIERQQRRAEAKLRRARVVSVFVDTGFFTTISDQSLFGDLIREARGHNIAGPSPGSAPFELGQLIQIDPDVYLATSDSGTTLADLRKDRRTRKLQAVQDGRFATLDVALLEPGPRIGEALLKIARLLHPDAFR